MHDVQSTPAGSRWWRRAVPVLLLALGLAILRLSWLGDDALITFRSVENLVNGHGPVWNVGERVQTYTHPLWFLLLCAARLVTGECMLTAQILGIALSVAAATWSVRTLGTASAAVVVLVLLLCSRAFTNYATSGLETSLTCLLVVALCAAHGTREPERRLRRVALVCGLLGTTRYDLLLLCLPALAACLRGVPARRAVGACMLAAAPIAAWGSFAIVYYGSPFPITACAKLFCNGVPAADLAAQGLRYVLRSVADDPVTPAVLLAGIAAGLGAAGQRALALGALLYTLYVVRVGGDYMVGRFLVPSFTLAALVLAKAVETRRAGMKLGVCTAAVLLAFVPGVPQALRPVPAEKPRYALGEDGIVEEQISGHWDHGLLAPSARGRRPGFLTDMLRAQGYTLRAFTMGGAVGWLGFGAGPQIHVIDPWLCDPLLMRLPVADLRQWRIGHFFRRIPAGYLESLASGENRIRHAGLARLHDAVRSIARDPIWSAARWRNMVDLWTGRFDEEVADYVANEYRTPKRLELPFAEIAATPAPGTWWFDATAGHSAQAGGLAIRMGGSTTAAAIIVHVSNAAGWHVAVLRDGVVVGRPAFTPTPGLPPDHLRPERIALPAGASPFDTIWIDADIDLEKPAPAFVGGIELVR